MRVFFGMLCSMACTWHMHRLCDALELQQDVRAPAASLIGALCMTYLFPWMMSDDR